MAKVEHLNSLKDIVMTEWAMALDDLTATRERRIL